MLELRARIHGTVHGVGFRATTKALAEKLHLTGFVCNNPDGTVEICAQGEKQSLEKLLQFLQREFGSQYIHRIDTAFHPIAIAYSDFKITQPF